MQTRRITLSMRGMAGNVPVSPKSVRLGDLRQFAKDTMEFVAGSARDVDTRSLHVSIKHGSLAFETQPLPIHLGVFADIESLSSQQEIGAIDTKRRTVLMRWQTRAHREQDISYLIEATGFDKHVNINKNTDFYVEESNHWVRVERYINGEIENMGGAGSPNAHIRLPDGNTLTVAADRDLLRNDEVNRLYKNALLRITAKYNVHTKKIRDAVLLGFVEQSTQPDEAAIAGMLETGARAWQDVKSASKWVAALRGSDGE